MSNFEERSIFKYKTHTFDVYKEQFSYVYKYTCMICNGFFLSYDNMSHSFKYNKYENLDEFIQNSGCCLSCNEEIIKNIIK